MSEHAARIVVVTGSRDWECFDLAVRILSDLVVRTPGGFVVHHGNARGVDRSFRDAARTLGLRPIAHEPRWHDLSHPDARVMQGKHGPYDANAGPRRNAEMIAIPPDVVIACHPALELSAGTFDTAMRALNARIPVYHFRGETCPPARVRSLRRGAIEYHDDRGEVDF